ncbi:hypothetical protein psal_cds_443 [Pandoravirus salinus]|uniref:DUF5878 domain-containing protein n=1 Tax=Pandoravirus salinus TaxID=1349410 RepID=S4VUH0_9VIRU|nr:hypothetical protein psal_cds_443 [Pandoravirus salinus]AGO84194.1 hypothetical protein psal_cds_443 [Pandoravirus salinus]
MMTSVAPTTTDETMTIGADDQEWLAVDASDERVDRFVARVCDAMDRSRSRVRIRVQVADGEDPDKVFGPIGERLVRQCGVLSVHTISERPLVYEMGPRAVDAWGPAIDEVICAHHGRHALVVDPLAIYQRTAKKWRNLLRQSPLSMTLEESRLLTETIVDIAARHALQALPTDDDRVWLFGAGV